MQNTSTEDLTASTSDASKTPIIDEETLRSHLKEAVRKGEIETVKSLLAQNENLINTTAMSRWHKEVNLLYLAAESGNLELFNFLKSKGLSDEYDARSRDPSFWDHLVWHRKCLTPGNIEMIMHQPYALHCFSYHLNLVSFDVVGITCSVPGLNFLVHVEANKRKDWSTFLYKSFQEALRVNADTAVFEWLISAGVDLNTVEITPPALQTTHGTLLHFASSKGYQGIIPFLISKGFNINQTTDNGYTPLDFADSVIMFNTLCQHGASVKACSLGGLSLALKLLKDRNRDDLLAALFSNAEFNPHLTDKRGNNYSHILMGAWWITDIAHDSDFLRLSGLIKMLKAHGVNINAKNIFGATPLDLATNAKVREILIEQGAVQHFSGEIHPGIQAVLQSPVEKEPELSETPSVGEFQKAVKEFKVKYGVKSVKMLYDNTNPARCVLRQRFFAHPTIGRFLSRESVQNVGLKPVVGKYEQHFYESGPDNDPKSCIPYRVTPRCETVSSENEFGVTTPIPFMDRFYMLRAQSNVSKILKDKFSEFVQSLNDDNLSFINAGDVYGVPHILDKMKENCPHKGPFVFILMNAIREIHSLTFLAVFDVTKKETVVVLDCDANGKGWYFQEIKQRINLYRDYDRQFLVLDCSQGLQTQRGDLNCDLYSTNTNCAIMTALSQNTELRTLLTQYSKDELLANNELQSQLINKFQHALRPHLPYYQYSEETKEYSMLAHPQINQYHFWLRWQIGREDIIKKITAAQEEQSPPKLHK